MRVKGTRDIAKLRDEAKAAIDAAYNKAMTHPALMSPGDAITATYIEQAREATAYLLNPDEYTPGDYPWIEDLVGVNGETLEQAVQIVVNMAYMWRPIGARLNRIRLAGKNTISEATTPAAIEAARVATVNGFGQILAQLSSSI